MQQIIDEKKVTEGYLNMICKMIAIAARDTRRPTNRRFTHKDKQSAIEFMQSQFVADALEVFGIKRSN